jgi:cell division transport system permease protein
VYLKDNITQQERDFLLTRLRAEQGVKKVVYLSKADALALLKKELKGQESLMEGLGENPLPDSYEAVIDPAFADSAKLEPLAKRIAKFHGVEDVSYGRQGAEVLDRLLKLVTWGGVSLAVLLGVTVVFIISNSVRLALYSRGQEIELMQWIGATRWFILGPFLVEGMLVAVLGTSLAVGVLAGVFHALPRDVVLFLSGPGGLDFLPTSVVAYMIAGGGALGFAGGMVSVNKFLECRRSLLRRHPRMSQSGIQSM